MELQLIKKEITGIGKRNKVQKKWQLVCWSSLSANLESEVHSNSFG